MTSRSSDETQSMAASSNEAANAARVATELRNGPRGALFLSTVAVLLILAGWLAFYFLLFIPRGPIG
ncbi:hypothetical protein [Rhizobium mesoamericanum]|uniref:hypothetical protein n=1 Tax=Rhizobium mesoamericanum TaxID=1079800 RepID=UPI0012DF4E3A|nr:hypothetical protein [Rhizobium mesoamericanum]